jgi:hypothetical protein
MPPEGTDYLGRLTSLASYREEDDGTRSSAKKPLVRKDISEGRCAEVLRRQGTRPIKNELIADP